MARRIDTSVGMSFAGLDVVNGVSGLDATLRTCWP